MILFDYYLLAKDFIEEQSGAHGGFWDALGSHGPIKSANQGEANAEQKIQRGAGQKRLFR